MQDPLLYRPIHRIPVAVVKHKVSEATGIPLSLMLLSNRHPTARRREYVTARMISMTLSMKYSHKSLAYVGREHGGYDHATVLHACKTIQNLLDTKDIEVTKDYSTSVKFIDEWNGKRSDIIRVPTLSQLYRKKKILLLQLNDVYDNIAKLEKITIGPDLVKAWIKNRVPLEIRDFQCKFYKRIKTKQL